MATDAKNKDREISAFRRFYRVFRWCLLGALLLVILLALKRPGDVPEAPDPATAPEQARQFETKLEELENAKNRGDSGTQTQFSAGEINAFLAQSIATRTPATPALPAPTAPNPASSSAAPAAQPVAAAIPASEDAKGDPATVKDFRIALDGDEVTGFFVVDFHGKDMNITISGRPGVSNGYMTFTPTGFRVGSLSIPVFLVDPSLQKRLNEPETHEKLKLPDFVSDLRVQDHQMVITEK